MQAPSQHKVKNRAELRSLLEDSLVSPEEEPEAIRILTDDEDRSLKPKTYVIESNTDVATISQNGWPLEPSDDKTLWNIPVSTSPDPFYVYLDTLDKRYWYVHSLYYAPTTDRFVNSFVSGSANHLDHVWLASDDLQTLTKDKTPLGFGLSYANVFASEEEGSGLSATHFGAEIREVLKGMRQIPPIRNQIALSSIRVGYQSNVGYVKEDIYRWGKMIAKKGDSIDTHLNLIDSVKDYYSKTINELESKYETKYNYSENYCTIEGSYSVIRFSTRIPNLTRLADLLTSGSKPFRIWGIWRPIDEGHIRLHGIDQHTNTPVQMELMEDELRIMLGEGACGNVVTRLFTNVQSGLDSNCELRGLDNDYIIKPHTAS